MFEELRKFKDKGSHCTVPGNYSENTELVFWTGTADVWLKVMFEELMQFKDK